MNTFHKILAGMLAAAALCCLPACRKNGDIQQDPSANVTLGQLQKRIFRKQLPVQGVVQPVESAVISANVDGVLANVNTVEGDYAKSGDVLFCIDRQVLDSDVTIWKNEVAVLRASFESMKIKSDKAAVTYRQLERDYERERKLREANVNSKAAFEAAETAYLKAALDISDINAETAKTEARLKQAQDNLAIAQRRMENALCTAPYDCVVTEQFAKPHEYVKIGQKILKIENHDRLEVICQIAAARYADVAVGRTRAEIFMNGQSVCSGVVTYKSPDIDPREHVFKLKITMPDKSSLTSGATCDVKLILLEKEAWGIPNAALTAGADGNQAVAFVAQEDGTAKSVKVVTGIVDGALTEVINYQDLKDLSFITSGQEGLEDGMTIGVRQ